MNTLWVRAKRMIAVVGSSTVVFACGTGPLASPGASESNGMDASTMIAVPHDESGARLVAARGCPQCHQSSDPEDGILSGQTEPLAGTGAFGANLTPDVETGIGGWTDDAVVRAIRTGVDDEGAALCAPMPQFRDMSDSEASAIVAYLRSLPPVRRMIPESDCGGVTEDGGATEGGSAPLVPVDADASVAAAASDASVDAEADPNDASVPGARCEMVAPDVPASCRGCSVPAKCNPNGCYGGYWCAPSTQTCHRKPASCP